MKSALITIGATREYIDPVRYISNESSGLQGMAIIEHLIKIFSKKNSLVVDPFLGSGTTAIACKNTDRNCIGIEINPEYYEISRTRCEL